MSRLLSTATSRDEAERAAPIAVLPVGSFEQHGEYLPLSTDTLIACIIAREIADTYNLMLAPRKIAGVRACLRFGIEDTSAQPAPARAAIS